jgi:hypothetical protein
MIRVNRTCYSFPVPGGAADDFGNCSKQHTEIVRYHTFSHWHY